MVNSVSTFQTAKDTIYQSCHDQVAEVAVQLFISNDKPNCSGLILAGSADFKTELSQSDMFDSRLQVSDDELPEGSIIKLLLFQAKIIKLVDISYGGENGFNQV